MKNLPQGRETKKNRHTLCCTYLCLLYTYLMLTKHRYVAAPHRYKIRVCRYVYIAQKTKIPAVSFKNEIPVQFNFEDNILVGFSIKFYENVCIPLNFVVFVLCAPGYLKCRTKYLFLFASIHHANSTRS